MFRRIVQQTLPKPKFEIRTLRLRRVEIEVHAFEPAFEPFRVDLEESNLISLEILANDTPFHPFEAFQEAVPFDASFEVQVYDETAFIQSEIFASENLVDSLPPIRVFGTTYQDQQWQPLHEITPSKPSTRGRKKRGTGDSSQPELFQSDPANDASMGSPWKLIYVLLKPPLDLEQPDGRLLPYPLYPYQREGIKFLIDRPSALLADDMGTGKTVMSTVALRLLIQQRRVRHVLILCPVSVLLEWDKHLHLWAPELHVTLVRGNPAERRVLWKDDFHVYVTTYDTFKNDFGSPIMPVGRRFDLVLIDEAHHIKNRATDRFRALRKVEAGYRWALTGTPIQNKIDELHTLFDFLVPNHFKVTDFSADQPHRVRDLIAPYFLRRRKDEVLKDLPPKQHQHFWLELDSDQRQAYDLSERTIRTDFERNGFSRIGMRGKLMTLMQLCNFASERGDSPKLDILTDQIESILAGDRKVIVFSQFIDEGIEKLENALRPYGLAKLVGGQSDGTRRAEIENFKKSPNINILIASVRAGGEGLNLTEASYVVHFDHWWNPAVMWQAEARVHRRGAQFPVNVYSYWMRDTVEERIYKLLEAKGLLFESLFNETSEGAIDAQITDEELFALFQPESSPPAQERDWKGASLVDIRERLFSLTPGQFERLAMELMRRWGYQYAQVVGGTGDGGIDVQAQRNTAHGVEIVAAQCKRYRNTVGVEVAREFHGALQDKSIKVGYLVTTSDFSTDCQNFCQRNGIKLVSGNEISKDIKRFGLPL